MKNVLFTNAALVNSQSRTLGIAGPLAALGHVKIVNQNAMQSAIEIDITFKFAFDNKNVLENEMLSHFKTKGLCVCY